MTESELSIGETLSAFPILLFLLMMFRPDVVVVAGTIGFLVAYSLAYPAEAISTIQNLVKSLEEALSLRQILNSIEPGELLHWTIFIVVFSVVATGSGYLYIKYVLRPDLQDSDTDWIDSYFGGGDCE